MHSVILTMGFIVDRNGKQYPLCNFMNPLYGELRSNHIVFYHGFIQMETTDSMIYLSGATAGFEVMAMISKTDLLRLQMELALLDAMGQKDKTRALYTCALLGLRNVKKEKLRVGSRALQSLTEDIVLFHVCELQLFGTPLPIVGTHSNE